MNDGFAEKIRSASVAGWWTLLIATGFMVVNWLGYLIIMNIKPDWLLDFWGGGEISWADVQLIWFGMAALFKVLIWILALVVIWLTLWARRLRKSQS